MYRRAHTCIFHCHFNNGSLGLFESTRYARGPSAYKLKSPFPCGLFHFLLFVFAGLSPDTLHEYGFILLTLI
jgi:hypothetical protein